MADKVEPNKAIRLTLLKPNGEPYSDATFHTQMNAVLHNESMLKAHPVLRDYRLKYVHKSTTLFMVKDHRHVDKNIK